MGTWALWAVLAMAASLREEGKVPSQCSEHVLYTHTLRMCSWAVGFDRHSVSCWDLRVKQGRAVAVVGDMPQRMRLKGRRLRPLSGRPVATCPRSQMEDCQAFVPSYVMGWCCLGAGAAPWQKLSGRCLLQPVCSKAGLVLFCLVMSRANMTDATAVEFEL